MKADIISTLLTGVLTGGVVASVLTFVRDRRKDKTDYTVATYQTLAQMNDRLKTEVKETRAELTAVQAELDTERHLRRELEDRVASLERTREQT